ncbi:MAG: hypothetical protein ACE5KT_07765 [Methanosarcinales archaeon]
MKIPKIDLEKVDVVAKNQDRVRELVIKWAGRLRSPTLQARSTLPSVAKNQ